MISRQREKLIAFIEKELEQIQFAISYLEKHDYHGVGYQLGMDAAYERILRLLKDID